MNIKEKLINSAKKSEKSIIASSILTLVVGIMLAIYPGDTLSIITKIIGAFLMVFGVVQIINYFKNAKEDRVGSASFAFGIILFAVGLYIFINDASLTKFVTTIIGILICIKSVYKIQLAISLKDYSNSWKYNLVSGLIVLSIGLIVIFYPYATAATILRVIGIALIVASVYEIIESVVVIKKIDTTVKDLPFKEKGE
jgi:uncharacterized membrane protein HdeD (DUF308 family)